jgi:hypothetical protein
MNTNDSPPKAKPMPCYSRSLARGSLGSDLDGRSREGRFARRIETDLLDQLGGSPPFSQRLAVRRIARLMLSAELLDKKLASGNWTSHDSRTASGSHNGILRALKDIGLRAQPPRQPSLAEVLRQGPAV